MPSWYPTQPDDVGGSFFREQAMALQAAGNQVGVIVSELRSIRKPIEAIIQSRKMSREIDNGIPTYRKYSPNFTPGVASLTGPRIVRNGLKMFDRYVSSHGKPDILHVHASLYAGAIAMELKKRHAIPFVVSEHSTAYARDLLSNSAIRLAARISAQANNRFAVSSPFARLLEKTLGTNGGNWSVMPNSVSDIFLQTVVKTADPTKFCFLHISNLNTHKQVDVILTAFAARFREKSDVSLTIAGGGPDLEALKQLAQELDISKQTRFTGMLSRDQVRTEMANSDAFLLSSRAETFGVVLIEAMAMGLPVVATRCGGPEDIVEDSTGLLVNVADIDAYGDAMVAIRENKSRYPAEKLRSICTEKYSADVLTRRWMDIYSGIVATRPEAEGVS